MAFLALTVDQRYWKIEGPVVFLGEWCKEYRARALWEPLDHKTLNYHWEDRRKLYEDVKYIEEVYEKYLSVLSSSLNSIHQKNYSERYWRIVIGFWLRNFIDALYDRYLSILTACECKELSATYICDTSPRYPKKPVSFAWDDYNLYLYSRIIEKLNIIPYEKLNYPILQKNNFSDKPNILKRISGEMKRQFSKGFELFVRQGMAVCLVEHYPRLVGKLNARVVFAGSLYLSAWNQIKLQLSLLQFPYVFHGKKIFTHETKPNIGMRRSISLSQPVNAFEELLN